MRYLVVFLALLGGCASVAGRIRPVWNQSWSRLDRIPSGSGEELRVLLRGPDGKLPLPGAAITITDQRGHSEVAVTDVDGAASFRPVAGTVSVKTELPGFATHRCSVSVTAGQTAVLEVFTRRTTEEIVACCDG